MRDWKKTANNKVITDSNGFEAKLWLAADIRGIEADFGPEHADTFCRDHRADYVLANPHFNDSDWFRKDDDVRLQFGVPRRTKCFVNCNHRSWTIQSQEVESRAHKLS